MRALAWVLYSSYTPVCMCICMRMYIYLYVHACLYVECMHVNIRPTERI